MRTADSHPELAVSAVMLLHAVRQGTCTETQAGRGVSLHTTLV